MHLSSTWCAAIAVIAMCGAAYAQDEEGGGLAEQLNLNGSVRAAYYGKSRDLDNRQDLASAALWLKAAPRVSDDISLRFDGWVRNDDTFDDDAYEARLREGYLRYSTGDVDIRLGNQIISWGRADALNPTDNLSPRNYTLLVPENDDQRLGTTAVKVDYHLSDVTATFVYVPLFSQSKVPIPPQPGITVTDKKPNGGSAGVKLDYVGSAIEGSVSFYDGFDLIPDLQIESLSAAGLDLSLRHRRIKVLGLDGAATVGDYGLRWEGAYTWTLKDSADPLRKKPFFYAVAGFDRTFDGNININLQYYLRHVTGYRDPAAIPNPNLRDLAVQAGLLFNQTRKFDNGVSMRIASTWLNDTLEGEIAGVVSLSGGDAYLKPRLIYALNDHWKARLGADIFMGEKTKFFGRLQDNSSVFLELQYNF